MAYRKKKHIKVMILNKLQTCLKFFYRFLLFDLVELQELLLKVWRIEILFHSGKAPSSLLPWDRILQS